ncbi:hypothetical protein PMIN01_03419 [Paraphaeosphaeria minitans]|uniref:Uncharacterized protein n=1 Tax=Paraphaeosphaeria minitans TaxID=565426 RepID=A0A9P6GMT7_9PLEO|nr:hypothetical protein PMIN01_03419 [Paraphaeosphaeria minitans]
MAAIQASKSPSSLLSTSSSTTMSGSFPTGEPTSKDQTLLNLGVYTLPSQSRFQSANDVRKAFRLESKEATGPKSSYGRKSSPKARDWTMKYREGTKHSWTEPPVTLEPDVNVTNWGRFWNPLKAPSPKALKDRGLNYISRAKLDNMAHYEDVFIIWKSNHRRNYDYDDDYATIPHLEDWEMKCALEGNWARLSHMLTVPKKKNPAQQLGERKLENMRPLKDWKGEWYLAKKVFWLKQKHDEWKKTKMEGCVEVKDLHKERDDVAESFEEEVEAAESVLAIAGEVIVPSADSDPTLTANRTPSPAPMLKKRKRAVRGAETAPMAQSNGDELRRGKRARKATVPFGSRNEGRSPVGNRSTTIAAPAPNDNTSNVVAPAPNTTTTTTNLEAPSPNDESEGPSRVVAPRCIRLIIGFGEPPVLRVPPTSS